MLVPVFRVRSLFAILGLLACCPPPARAQGPLAGGAALKAPVVRDLFGRTLTPANSATPPTVRRSSTPPTMRHDAT